MKGRISSTTIPIVGMMIVANRTRFGPFSTRKSSNRKKKYQSGRGTYVVVVGSAFGPCSAPKTIESRAMTRTTTRAIVESFSTA